MRTEPTYKRMTPPPTQKLKALGLRVFFLICCSVLILVDLPDFSSRILPTPNSLKHKVNMTYVKNGFSYLFPRAFAHIE